MVAYIPTTVRPTHSILKGVNWKASTNASRITQFTAIYRPVPNASTVKPILWVYSLVRESREFTTKRMPTPIIAQLIGPAMEISLAKYQYNTENHKAIGIDGTINNSSSNCQAVNPLTKRYTNCPIMMLQANHQKR